MDENPGVQGQWLEILNSPPFKAFIPADFHTYDVIYNNKQQRTQQPKRSKTKATKNDPLGAWLRRYFKKVDLAD